MRLDFSVDDGMAKRAAIGLIVLQSDETLEPEISPLLMQKGVTVYHSRIPSAHEITPETLAQMHAEMPKAASMLPSVRPMNVVAYCCTSGATVIGTENVAQAIRQHHATAAVTNPISAVIAACKHLGITRLGLVTPYVPAVSVAIREKLEENGISIVAFGSFEQEEETVVARIDAHSIKQAVCQVGSADEVQAVFASCTNLRTLDVIEDCEAVLGKPMISSNLALAWHILTSAGLGTEGVTGGRLFAF